MVEIGRGLLGAARQVAREGARVVPVEWRMGRTYWRWRRFLGAAQYWPARQIRAWQDEQLARIVAHAYEHTEGYRELYRQAGVRPGDVRSLDDLRHLPFVTKELLRDNLEAFSVPGRGRRYLTTGGSTGIPFGFYGGRELDAIEWAFMHTDWGWAGWRLGDRSAVLRGAYIGSEAELFRQDRYKRELLLSTYYLRESNVAAFADAITAWGARTLQSYPSALNLLCDLLHDTGLAGRLSFDVILLGSENAYDWQLRKFAATFPTAQLMCWYGHAERAILAPWCRASRRYHAWPFYGATEVLTDTGAEAQPGDEGELVGTSFHGRVTPFIRYRTMDRAVKGPARCDRCGRDFPLLESISGRSHEVIVTSSGRYISMTMINMHDAIFDQLRQFQFYQDRPGAVVFNYVPKGELTAAQADGIRRGLAVKLGGDMELELRAVASIPRTRSGKYRFLDQRLAIRYSDEAS
jgi:phenylacetate-CoA ligase